MAVKSSQRQAQWFHELPGRSSELERFMLCVDPVTPGPQTSALGARQSASPGPSEPVPRPSLLPQGRDELVQPWILTMS